MKRSDTCNCVFVFNVLQVHFPLLILKAIFVYPLSLSHRAAFRTSSAVGRQVTDLTVTPSTLHTGDVPVMNVSFTPSTTVPGNGTLTLALQGTSPVPGLEVFANATPEERGVVLVGLPNCSGATGAIDAVNHTLTITLPSTCVLDAFEPVKVVIPSGFFAPNPAIGTTVTFTMTTSTDVMPSEEDHYTTGVHVRGYILAAAQQCPDVQRVSFHYSFYP